MSALGQKQTFYVALRESALPPKADIGCAAQYVRFVPKADVPSSYADVFEETPRCHRLRSLILGDAQIRAIARSSMPLSKRAGDELAYVVGFERYLT